MLMALRHCHLVISTAEVNSTENACPVEFVQEVVYARDGIAVNYCVGVQRPVVNDNAHGPILFLYEQHRMTVLTVAFADPSLFEEGLNLSFTLVQFKRQHPVGAASWYGSVWVLQGNSVPNLSGGRFARFCEDFRVLITNPVIRACATFPLAHR